ncbi:lactoferrin/transferrin family TonB-dependent receptor [Kingella kingae]|uniref:lactoferrin/transferrin family TonB-dependent receptor n=1 Tax=Kingella kingae TaxID=504 RepID=UPI0032B55B12
MMNQKTVFRLNIICLSLLSTAVQAETTTQSTETLSQNLENIKVTTKKQKHRRENEVTGLGKLVKTAESISKEQVLGIRDLTRYDPGITVVEQGRGASSGYSVRGMDRNRVALVVDGLPQAQSYIVQAPMSTNKFAGSGAINEIEYENVKSIEISKGSNSSEYGSGALAGSVAFQTKQAADIIPEGKSWGLQTKNAYASKNSSLTHSIAFAGRSDNGLEGLLIFTDRQGHEIKGHKDAARGVQSYSRYQATTENSNGYFVMADECVGGYDVCKMNPKPPVKEEIVRETVSVQDYTGPNRFLADPLNYGSHSWLFRPGYHFNNRHYIGATVEHTEQKFDMRDMSIPSYLVPDSKKILRKRTGYLGTNPAAALSDTEGLDPNGGYGIRYATGVFHDERHTKVRFGPEYIYENPDKNTLFDYVRLSYDRQNIRLKSHMQLVHCSEWPYVDKNCRPSTDKPLSAYKSDSHSYVETHNVFQAAFKKTFELAGSKHKINGNIGYDHFKSDLQHDDYYYLQALLIDPKEKFNPDLPRPLSKADILISNKRNGRKDFPYYLTSGKTIVSRSDQCNYRGNSENYSDCSGRVIKGSSYYFALQDNMRLSKHLDLGIGVRYDYRKTHSTVNGTNTGQHKKWSWNVGVVVKPTNWLDLSYRISTGFRLPSFSEMYGWRYGHPSVLKTELKPEQSRNREAGITLKGSFGHLEASYFNNDYRDLITFGCQIGKNKICGDYGYLNGQNARLGGVNVLGKIYWNGVWDKLPDGLYTTVAYNKVKVKNASVKHNIALSTSPLFDALQPSRYVIGIGYDQPDGQWGVNLMQTYSQAKSNNELLGSKQLAETSIAQQAAKKRTRSWKTTDVSAYYNIKKFLTLRAGVYNLFNYRYTTWESVRQTASDAVNQHRNVGVYNRYAAPGRNYTVTLEMKF